MITVKFTKQRESLLISSDRFQNNWQALHHWSIKLGIRILEEIN